MRLRPDSLVLFANIARAVGFSVCAVAGLAVAGVAQADSLRDIVERTLATNPDVGIAVQGRRAAAFEVDQANALFRPTVDFRGTAGEEFLNDRTSRDAAAISGHGNTAQLPRYEAGVTLRQLLYDGEETESEVALRTARRQSASRRVLQTSVSVALSAIEAYLEAQRHRELVALAKETVTAHEQTLRHVAEMAAGGAADVADVKQAESRLARARDDFAQARNRLEDADATYRKVVGEAAGNLERPEVPVQALPANVAAAVEMAVGSNAAVKVAKSELHEAEAAYRKSRSSFLPKLNFEVSANSARNLDGIRTDQTDVSALLVMNYNLYRGGGDIARRQSLIARLSESRQRLTRATRQVEERARKSWNALRNGRDRVTALENAVHADEIVRSTYRAQFDLNQRSLLDLLDSENDLFIAKANLISSQFAVIFGTYRVLATTGQLLSALHLQPPPEAYDTGFGEAPPAARPAPPQPVAPRSDMPAPAPQHKSALDRGRNLADSVLRPASGPALPSPRRRPEYAKSIPEGRSGSEKAVPVYWGFN